MNQHTSNHGNADATTLRRGGSRRLPQKKANCGARPGRLFLLALLLVFVGCRGAAGDEANQPYKIGFVLALSGAGSVFADAARQGMELAVEQINASGSAGRPIAITIVDDATDPRTAAEVCNRLVTQERVNAIIGYESTPARVACNQAALRAGIPYIASSMSGGDLCLPNLFQVGMAPWGDCHDRRSRRRG
jgi:ABC-type branched-subunit amino acid transport system substrate-binding protein